MRRKNLTINMFCENCGKQIDEVEEFCKYCGVKINKINFSTKSKKCPFCKEQVGLNERECPNCRRILFENIKTKQESTPFKEVISNQKKKAYFLKQRIHFLKNTFFRFINFAKKPNYSKIIFNKYVAILFGVILIVWIFSGDNSSYKSGGTKAPLPPPTTQISDDVVEFIPSAPAVSLANGTILKRNNVYLREYGKLHIKNGTTLDAVAKLIRGGTSVLTVYIKANSNYTIPGISDGIYWLAFAQGLDWDSTTQKFRRNVQYSAFDETFDFTTTEDYQYIYYPEFEVTLHPVVGGTAETSPVDPEQFNAY